MFIWKRLGQVFDSSQYRTNPWMWEFAQCPTPVILNDEIVRVFVACRPQPGSDLQYVSYPCYVDLDRRNITSVAGVSAVPLMSLGQVGAFDEFGIMPSSIVRRDRLLYMYYSGWTRMKTTPYALAIGMAVSSDDGRTFDRVGAGPAMAIGLHDPYFVTGPIVRPLGDGWRMWYLSCKRWEFASPKPEPIYQIRHAVSDDGLTWHRSQAPVIPVRSSTECQDILAPFHYGGSWHAIFAWRDAVAGDGRYTLGYASSEDLNVWQRDDAEAGLGLSVAGWDSEMMCYPQFLELDGRLLMFYCGNEFGRGGFGIAELVGCEAGDQSKPKFHSNIEV